MTDFVVDDYDGLFKEMVANCKSSPEALASKWLAYELRHQDGTLATDQEVEEMYQTMLKLIKKELDANSPLTEE